MPDPDAEVTVGVVGKPVGLRGEVYVRPDTDLPVEVFDEGRTLRVRRPEAGSLAERPPEQLGEQAGDAVTAVRPATLRVAATRVQSGRRVVRFEGISTREAAEALRHLELTLPRADLPLDEDAFWSADLLGREVVDHTGAVVGVLEAVADGTAHDYLLVARPDGGELLIPAVAELVDVGEDVIVVQAIPGLVDPEDAAED